MGVPPSDLEIIRESPEYHGAGEREAGMLKAWLERGLLPKTWQVLLRISDIAKVMRYVQGRG